MAEDKNLNSSFQSDIRKVKSCLHPNSKLIYCKNVGNQNLKVILIID